MAIDFLDLLTIKQVAIPPMVSRLAGFFLAMQILLIIFQKKNDPFKDIWEPISDVLLAGLIVYIFPEAIKFIELLVNTLCPVSVNSSSSILQYMKDSTTTDDGVGELSGVHKMAFFLTSMFVGGNLDITSVVNPITFSLVETILKPLADIVNVICMPTYLMVRAACLCVMYFVAPLVLVLGAMPPFRSLWNQWFMMYIALLVSAPALFLANDFCETCFDAFVYTTNSPLLGFITIAIARFKVFQAVIDLCYRIFRV